MLYVRTSQRSDKGVIVTTETIKDTEVGFSNADSVHTAVRPVWILL